MIKLSNELEVVSVIIGLKGHSSSCHYFKIFIQLFKIGNFFLFTHLSPPLPLLWSLRDVLLIHFVSLSMSFHVVYKVVLHKGLTGRISPFHYSK